MPCSLDKGISLRVKSFKSLTIKWLKIVLAPIGFTSLRKVLSMCAHRVMLGSMARHMPHIVIPTISFHLLIQCTNLSIKLIFVQEVISVAELVQNHEWLLVAPIEVVSTDHNFDMAFLLGTVSVRFEPTLVPVDAHTARLFHLLAVGELVRAFIHENFAGHDLGEGWAWDSVLDFLQVAVEGVLETSVEVTSYSLVNVDLPTVDLLGVVDDVLG